MRLLPVITAAVFVAAAVSVLGDPARKSTQLRVLDQPPAISDLRPLPLIAASPSGQPQLAVDHLGRVALSWLERIGSGPRYAFKYAFREGARWTSPQTIVESEDFFVNWADVPSIFPLAQTGRWVAHWLQKNGSGTYAYDVRLAISDQQAATWSEGRLPYTDKSQSEHGFASFFDMSGATGVTWLDGREMKPPPSTGGGGHDEHAPGAMTLRAAKIQPDGTISEDTRLDARVCECCPTAAVATSQGALVAYRDRSDDEIRDIAVLRLENGKWQGPTYVHADRWKIAACPVNGPALAAIGDRVALAWFTAEGDAPRALLAFSSDGGRSFGAPIRVDDVQTLGRVDVVMLPDGRAVVSWLEFLELGSELRARIIGPDGRRRGHFTITTSTADRQSGYARMVRSGNDLVFAWTSTRPSLQVKTAVLTVQ
jgi:hypothetical protein